jgi:hypothetical protein
VGDNGQGNLLGDKGFQFTIVPAVFTDSYGHYRPEKVENPTKAKNTWIYAIGYRLGDKGKLWGEYHADDKGALTFVSGDRRRALEPADVKKREKIDGAGLPTIIQKKPVTYAFVATRGQLSKGTIWEMENSLPQIYGYRNGGDFDLNDPAVVVTDASGQRFVPVVDVLSVGEELNHRYIATRNQALSYVNGKPNDDADQKKAEERRKKYQLAKLIKDQLYDPPKGPFDPLHLAKDSLTGEGKDLKECVSVFEAVTHSNDEASNRAADYLINFLLSSLWDLQHKWYWESDEGRNIGQYWIEASCNSIQRLRETPAGKDFVQWAVSTGWLTDCLFVPEQVPAQNQTPEESAKIEAANDQFFDEYTVVRKAGTAIVTGMGELAPAIIVYGKVREAAKRRVIDSISLIFSHAEVHAVVRRGGGEVVRRLHAEFEFMQIEIKLSKAKADLKEWVEQGKPHWPESKATEVAGHLFMLCEAFNFYSYLRDLLDKMNSQTATEAEKRKALIGAGGALLDLAVACEDPIRAYAKALDAQRAGNHAFATGAAEGGGEAEAAGIFGKMTAPAVFKALGVVSAAIDTYYAFWVEAPEADEAGDRAMARAKRTVGTGSAIILAASIANGAGYLAEAALLTAAASALLVVGVIVVAIGWAMTVYFSRTIWQKYVSHSSFGTEHGFAGKENWSGGDFSKWTSDSAGFDRQIQVLTAMLCSYKMSGTYQLAGYSHASDAETISVEFGVFPPGSKLELEFDLSYEAGAPYRPKYTLELDTRKCEREGPGEIPTPLCYPVEGGPVKHVVFSADRPSWATNTRVKQSSCSVVVRYAPQNNSDVATGIIPIGGPCTFKIYDGFAIDYHEANSLDFKPKGAE